MYICLRIFFEVAMAIGFGDMSVRVRVFQLYSASNILNTFSLKRCFQNRKTIAPKRLDRPNLKFSHDFPRFLRRSLRSF